MCPGATAAPGIRPRGTGRPLEAAPSGSSTQHRRDGTRFALRQAPSILSDKGCGNFTVTRGVSQKEAAHVQARA